MNIANQIPKIIEEILTARNWSQYRLARELGVADASIGNWVYGRSVPRQKYLDALALLRVTPPEAEPEPPPVVAADGYYPQLLAAILNHTGLSQTELATQLRVQQHQVSGWLRGEGTSKMTQEKIKAFAASLPALELPPVTVLSVANTWRERVLEIRKKRGWNQSQMAKQFGVSRQALSQWEAGVTEPNRIAKEEIARLEAELDLNPDLPQTVAAELERKLNEALSRIDTLERLVRLRVRLQRVKAGG